MRKWSRYEGGTKRRNHLGMQCERNDLRDVNGFSGSLILFIITLRFTCMYCWAFNVARKNMGSTIWWHRGKKRRL